MITSRSLTVILSVLAGLQVIAAASNLADLMSPTIAAWYVLVVAALQTGAAVYAGRISVTPGDSARAGTPLVVRSR